MDIKPSQNWSNKNFKRAVDFYIDSFTPLNVGIRFTLLFSALEALFNISKKDISKTIAKYGSKILFVNADNRKKYKLEIKRTLRYEIKIYSWQ